jgi:cytochrome c oxidase assembly factor CtaG
VVTPPLLLLGTPLMPLLFGLPMGRPRVLLGRLAARIDAWVGHPLAGLLAMSLATWGWHVVEHASFLLAGLLFWWPVVRPWPYRRRWPRPAMIPYLLLADLQNTALAAVLVFSDRVFYPSYGSGPAALADQVAAGVLMWVPMSLAYLVPAGVLTVRWLSPAPSRGR